MAEEKQIKELANKVSEAALLQRPFVEWRNVLSQECQVFVFGENYIAKRFDAINYKFVEHDEAEDILIDNLYALLRFKYFPKLTDEIDEVITKIIKSFTVNLKTTLKKISFDNDADCIKVSMLPDACVAFRNGVFNFRKNEWLFRYDVIEIEALQNKMYLYDPNYVILWYYNFNFDPLPVAITDVTLKEFFGMMKELNTSQRNYVFELMYNMSHDYNNVFDFVRFTHLCEILGYTCLQSFSQNFVLLIGAGQNGKNSLFDSSLTHRIIPKPASLSMDEIETDQFATGSLVNHAHNLFLETTAKTFVDSKTIKNLTGTTDISVNSKGVQKYNSYINCKYIFAGNDQEKIKFADTTHGFRRRINIFEVWYQWDSQKRFMQKGDFYDTSFSQDLHEIENDPANVTMYIYFAMYGILSGTKDFTRQFEFNFNEWKQKYSDIDVDLKEKIENVTTKKISEFMEKDKNRGQEECKTLFFDSEKRRLYDSLSLKELGYYNYDDLLKLMKDTEATLNYFAEYDVYMSIRLLQNIIMDVTPSIQFTQNLKKIYNVKNLESLYNNKPYIKCTFVNNKLKILGDD